MSVQPEHTGSEDIPNPTIDGIGSLAAWCFLSRTTESLQCAAGEIIVLRVSGEVDLCTVPILQAALDAGLDQHPAYLVVDLARMTYCSVRGLGLLTQAGHTAAEEATGYAVCGVLPQIDRVWALCWDGDLPVRYPSTAAAITAIRAAESDVQVRRGTPFPTTKPARLKSGAAPDAWSEPRSVVGRVITNVRPNERIEDVPARAKESRRG